MIETDDFKSQAADLINKHFREDDVNRGTATTLVADLVLRHEEIIKALYVRKTDTEKVEGADGR